jgi:hypothetical protein
MASVSLLSSGVFSSFPSTTKFLYCIGLYITKISVVISTFFWKGGCYILVLCFCMKWCNQIVCEFKLYSPFIVPSSWSNILIIHLCGCRFDPFFVFILMPTLILCHSPAAGRIWLEEAVIAIGIWTNLIFILRWKDVSGDWRWFPAVIVTSHGGLIGYDY